MGQTPRSESCLVLAIETSCDETAVAVVDGGRRILSSVVASQLDLHRQFGGVVPELASRKHVELLLPVLDQALREADLRLADIDLVAATRGPGLVGALLVGLTAAKALALALDRPFVGVNHLEGHLYANFLQSAGEKEDAPILPLVCLIASGGHTELVYMRAHGDLELLGQTRDDAAGEAFDKVARELGLGYPGGPAISRLARQGDPEALAFPRAYLEAGSLDFSFSGLKTHAVRLLTARRQGRLTFTDADFCAGFQEAIVTVLVDKTLAAVQKTGVQQVLLAGGVVANWRLRQEFQRRTQQAGLRLHAPAPWLCTDNAAMIAAAAYYAYHSGQRSSLALDADPSLVVGVR